jgi:hypothetical protein
MSRDTDSEATRALAALSELIYETQIAARENPEDDRERIDIGVARRISEGRYAAAGKLCYATLMGSERFETPHAKYNTVSHYFDKEDT